MITIDCNDTIIYRTVTRIIERLTPAESCEKNCMITDKNSSVECMRTLLLTDKLITSDHNRTIVQLPVSKKKLTEAIESFLTDNYI